MSIEKIQYIVSYLEGHFPGYVIETTYDSSREAHSFKLTSGNRSHLLRIGREFIGDNDVEVIGQRFENWQLANLVAETEEFAVLVTNDDARHAAR